MNVNTPLWFIRESANFNVLILISKINLECAFLQMHKKKKDGLGILGHGCQLCCF